MEQPRQAGSVIVAALETAYEAVRRNHSDLPGVVFIVGRGSAPRKDGRARLGHYAAGTWRARRARTARTPEIFIAGETMKAGHAREVMETVLHESAHALAEVREIAETSRQGRYHNRRFLRLAEELGLKHGAAEPDEVLGFSQTILGTEAKARYAGAIAQLDRALVANRLPPETDDSRNRNWVKATCGCPGRAIRTPRQTGGFAEQPAWCNLCRQPFLASR